MKPHPVVKVSQCIFKALRTHEAHIPGPANLYTGSQGPAQRQRRARIFTNSSKLAQQQRRANLEQSSAELHVCVGRRKGERSPARVSGCMTLEAQPHHCFIRAGPSPKAPPHLTHQAIGSNPVSAVGHTYSEQPDLAA